MYISVLITILGGFITIGITVNAFFLKGILNGQNEMRVSIAELLVKVENFSGRIDDLEHNVRKLELNAIECRSKCESTNTTMRT